MAEHVVDSGGRLKGERIVKRIIYGSESRLLRPEEKKNIPPVHTHQWKLYLKPFTNEVSLQDMSSYVKKVAFKLHESYGNPPDNPVTVNKCPYEVTRTGWGEFDALITIYWNDPAEKQIQLSHYIRLHKSPTEATREPLLKREPAKLSQVFETPDGNLISENYDELIFSDPTIFMRTLLTNTGILQTGPYTHARPDYSKVIDDVSTTLENAIEKASAEVANLRGLIHDVRSFKVKVAATRDKSRTDAGLQPETFDLA